MKKKVDVCAILQDKYIRNKKYGLNRMLGIRKMEIKLMGIIRICNCCRKYTAKKRIIVSRK